MMWSSWEKQKGDPKKHSEDRLHFLSLACSMRFVLWPKKQNAFAPHPKSIMLQDEITKHVEAGARGQLTKFLLCKHGHLGSIPSTCDEEEEEEVVAPWWRQLGVVVFIISEQRTRRQADPWGSQVSQPSLLLWPDPSPASPGKRNKIVLGNWRPSLFSSFHTHTCTCVQTLHIH